MGNRKAFRARHLAAALALLVGFGTACAQTVRTRAELSSSPPTTAAQQIAQPAAASAEARLMETYRLLAQGRGREALQRIEALVRDHPNFQLAQLVYGDLLLAQVQPLQAKGSGAGQLNDAAGKRLEQLRLEANRRLQAFRDRPKDGLIPAQFVELPLSSRHAIAVDVSRSRLYLFENTAQGLRLVSDHYASVGLLGADKRIEGDQRTPLGVYYITSRLDARQLTDFYGAGALPLNYPNEYDRRLGRTGSGIWLHGVPRDSYVRPPQSTDGCVALANPELQAILQTVQPRTTPVVIARSLDWVTRARAEPERRALSNLIEGWRVARSSGDIERLMSFYSPQFASGSRNLSQWRQLVGREMNQAGGRPVNIKDLAILGWRDQNEVLVVTFGEVVEGQRTGVMKRQYWGKEGGLWKIFYEGVIG
ncbi:L,D-transpeptidase family protein [Aquabacterium fontiphilum]|jgi:murein L,D-transpeptidase YafK|uniref:L,D-transpeptidase family protein n=1 Tax=Aquabacterium fontiphilum TaxID=450365 RepID=UPI0013765654|nr:L,D-transpeptidase family protein [Aquabacterium fontiphilum]NBD19885.1 L,D-transpeptidase family protein [Aquabacterium fontiphilum]